MKNDLTISFLTLRKVIGFIGLLMGYVVVLIGFFQDSTIRSCISDYYWTNVNNFFVGVMVSVGIFLLCYRGYERIDTIVNSITGICAIGVGLFPDNYVNTVAGIFCLPSRITSYFHITFALSFFLLLAYNSIFLFTKTSRKNGKYNPTIQKLKRNDIYTACGIIIFVSVFILILYTAFFKESWPYITSLILETLSLTAFGFSWIVKGETLSFLNDKE